MSGAKGLSGRQDTSDGKPGSPHQRVVYLDWLRVLAVLLLIPYHTARIFDAVDSFYVKSAETNIAFTAFVGFFTSWGMPLMFLLAGTATWFALGFRSPGQYALERFKRLIVPLIVGVLVIVPPQMYFAQRFHSQYAGSYLDFYPGFFQWISGSDYPGIGFSFAHLWFILFLFPMALICLPLFVFLRSKPGTRLTGGLAAALGKPGMILLLALPLPFTTLFDDPLGHNFTLYIIMFAYGYLLMSNERFQETVYSSRWHAASLGAIATIGYFALVLVWGTKGEEIDIPSILFQMAFNFSAWFWTMAFLGFGQKYLSVGNALLRYFSQASYPFYVLHQTAIVMIGYYVLQWQTGIEAQFAAIAAGALAATIAVYDLVIRRLNLTRALFGMKPKPPATQSTVISYTGEVPRIDTTASNP